LELPQLVAVVAEAETAVYQAALVTELRVGRVVAVHFHRNLEEQGLQDKVLLVGLPQQVMGLVVAAQALRVVLVLQLVRMVKQGEQV
jgi:hypothetical protein